MKLGRLASFVIGLVLLSAAACTAGDTPNHGTGPITFVSTAAKEGTGVFLRSQPTSVLFPNRVTVDVVARGATNLHGAAFRLSFNPNELAFIEASSGAPWSKQVLAMAKEGSPGEVAVVWAERGELGFDASGETVLGALVFEVRGRQGTEVRFRSERSQLVDKKGVRIDAAWAGGELLPR